MTKIAVHSVAGSEVGEVELNPEVFGVEPNHALLHQVVNAQLAGARAGTHKVKTRAEVRGGGAKPWRQKGTGRARHGSIRSPIWRGGGVAHGPTPRDYSQRTPKKMKKLALHSALSIRASEEAIKVIDAFDWQKPRTKDAASVLNAIEVENKALLVLGGSDEAARRAFRNLPQVWITSPDQISAYDVLWASQVIFTRHTLEVVNGGGTYAISKTDFVREGEAP